MKRYIYANSGQVDIYKGKIQRGYGENTTYGDTIVEILGHCVGNMEVFRVTITAEDNPSDIEESVYIGQAPKGSNLLYFAEDAWSIEEIGLDTRNYASAGQLIAVINKFFIDIIDNPISQYVIDVVGVDPFAEDWTIGQAQVLEMGRNYSIYLRDIQRKEYHICPDAHAVYQLMKNNGGKIDQKFASMFPNLVKYAKDIISKDHKEDRLRNDPYPYDATDDVVEAVSDLIGFINKLYSSFDLAAAEEDIKSRTIRNSRSYRYNDPEVAKRIEDLFDWAYDNNLSTRELKSASRKIYDKYLVVRRQI